MIRERLSQLTLCCVWLQIKIERNQPINMIESDDYEEFCGVFMDRLWVGQTMNFIKYYVLLVDIAKVEDL